MRRLLSIPAGTVLLILLTASPAGGQSPNQSFWLRGLTATVRETRGDPGRWFDWEAAFLGAARGVTTRQGITAAELEAVDRELRRAAGYLRAQPLLAEPQGFHPELAGSLQGTWGGPAGPIQSTIVFYAWGLHQERRDRAGRRVPDGDTWPTQLRFNALPPGEWPHWYRDDSPDGEMFLVPRTPPPYPGTMLVGPWLLVVQEGKPAPYVPVTVERVLRAFIAHTAGSQTSVDQQLTARRQALEDYLSPANEARRKAEIEENTRGFMNANRQDEATARRRAEAIDQQYVAELRARANPPADDPLFREVRAAREAETQLSAMTPAERAAAAWVAYDLEVGEQPLRPPGAREAAPVMRANPDFFDRRLPRTTLQSLAIPVEALARRVTEQVTRPDFVPERVHMALLQRMEWADFARQVLR